MSAVVINGDTSGSITLQAPAVAGTNTLTLPALTGTVLTSTSPQSSFPSNIAGNGPAFSAYIGTSQAVSANTNTKITFNTKDFDTNNCFDAITNYRFTPTVAGYYLITITFGTAYATAIAFTTLYKNGAGVFTGARADLSGAGCYANTSSTLIYFNGTTDYLEAYGYTSGTSFSGGSSGAYATKITGFLARSA